MGYFADHQYKLNFSEKLRLSQRGAIYAVGAHFTLSKQPALVVLPTGSGKTAILMVAPFLLASRRVLIITPSVAVRENIARNYTHLQDLLEFEVIPVGTPAPRVHENKEKINSLEAWEALRTFDVVVATPNSISPHYEDVPQPPENLFDLILVDEAHHSAALSWRAILTAFPSARQIMVTATPFRRDGKEVEKSIYTYPMQKAFEDGNFGTMVFEPVEIEANSDANTSIARAAERKVLEDRASGLTHILMVRAASIAQATELNQLYKQITNLRLGVAHSKHGAKHIDSILLKLHQGELDGIICVDMFGEGFNFPKLKIAALHAPHRSLAVTLQFIGRFARTNVQNIRTATILAVPQEIGDEANHIFTQNSAWQQMVLNYGQAHIDQQAEIDETLARLQAVNTADTDERLEDLSLRALRPRNHVKIYSVFGSFNLHKLPTMSEAIVTKSWISTDDRLAVFILQESLRPKWAKTDALNSIENNLFIVYYDEPTNLLFICATQRDESTYSAIARTFVEGYPKPLSLSKINHVLRGIQQLELFNLGMRNRSSGSNAEAYRMMAGSNVDSAIQPSDARFYHRGHVFGRGLGSDGMTTIGASSLAKVWRSDATSIPELLAWCKSLASKITNDTPVVTGSKIDALDTGIEITEIPQQALIAIDWADEIYRKPRNLTFIDENGEVLEECDALNVEFSFTNAQPTQDEISVILQTPTTQLKLHFLIVPYPKFEYADPVTTRVLVQSRRDSDLMHFLETYPLKFYFADGSLMTRDQLIEFPENLEPFDRSLMQTQDWVALHVDITREVDGHTPPQISIHNWLERDLPTKDFDVVFYDHGSGEMADFITIKANTSGQLTVGFYHCKGSGGATSGDRVEDLYEVCGQAVKSLIWRQKKTLFDKTLQRHNSNANFKFLKGTLPDFKALIDADPRKEVSLEIYIVQPGVSQANLSEKLGEILSAALQWVLGCQQKMFVICSE